MNRIIILGDGGHGKVVRDIAKACNYEVAAVLDDRYSVRVEVEGIEYGPIAIAQNLIHEDREARIIVAIGSNATRKEIVERIGVQRERYVALVHPTAVIGSRVRVGVGTVVMPNAVINAEASIGHHCIINTAAVIEHDSSLGDFVHVAPCAALAGGVNVCEGAFIGIRACILPGIALGSGATIGAGAVVIQDVADGVTVAGVPAKTTRMS